MITNGAVATSNCMHAPCTTWTCSSWPPESDGLPTNEEGLEVLVKAYDGEMNSVSKGKLHLIQDVASKLEKSEQEINLNVA